MTPGLLRPLTKSFDHRSSSNNNSSINIRSPAEVQSHFSWLHRRQHYSPAAQQQQLLLQQQQQQQQQQRGVDSFSRPATTEKRKALTLGSWGSNRLSGKSLLFEKLAKLKKKNGSTDLNNNNASSSSNGNNRPKPLFSGPQVSTSHCDDSHDDPLIVVCDFCTTNDDDDGDDDVGKEPEWLNIEKSVRFRLPETKMSDASKSNKSGADDDDDDDDDDGHEADFWGYYEPAPELERPNFGRRRERMFSCNEFHPSQHHHLQQQQQQQQHQHSARGGSFCPEHPVKRNLSYGEGLNEFQYLPGAKDPTCCPCCCSLPVMMMPPPPGCSRCCPVMTPSARHYDDRFSHLYPNRQVSMAQPLMTNQFKYSCCDLTLT